VERDRRGYLDLERVVWEGSLLGVTAFSQGTWSSHSDTLGRKQGHNQTTSLSSTL
jgi:hypothetical protein